MNGEPRFAADATVCLKSASDQVDRVHEVRWNDGAECYAYAVDRPAGRKAVFERNLVAVEDHTPNELYAGAEAFQTLITFERLVRPPSRVAATFGSARAAFYPYQFKPLLKFLESGTNRVLIADDVGLGKAIEAGYILRELRPRTVAIDRILIIVPARLRYNRIEELSRWFDEDFELVRRSGVVNLFGMLKARNLDTDQHRMAADLAEDSDAVVYLTANPVQAGLENLYHLLRLLEPANFSSNALHGAQPDDDAALGEHRCLARRSWRFAVSEQRAPLRGVGRAERRRGSRPGVGDVSIRFRLDAPLTLVACERRDIE